MGRGSGEPNKWETWTGPTSISCRGDEVEIRGVEGAGGQVGGARKAASHPEARQVLGNPCSLPRIARRPSPRPPTPVQGRPHPRVTVRTSSGAEAPRRLPKRNDCHSCRPQDCLVKRSRPTGSDTTNKVAKLVVFLFHNLGIRSQYIFRFYIFSLWIAR